MDGYTEAQRGRDSCPRSQSQTQAPAQGLVSDGWPTLSAFGREHHVISALTRWPSTVLELTEKLQRAPSLIPSCESGIILLAGDLTSRCMQ